VLRTGIITSYLRLLDSNSSIQQVAVDCPGDPIRDLEVDVGAGAAHQDGAAILVVARVIDMLHVERDEHAAP
jgi:hypothetical protein